jgi:hypothetical protein
MSGRIHYAGALTWKTKGTLHRALAGWPVCWGLTKKGRITHERKEVTCAHCRVRLAWADATKEKVG